MPEWPALPANELAILVIYRISLLVPRALGFYGRGLNVVHAAYRHRMDRGRDAHYCDKSEYQYFHRFILLMIGLAAPKQAMRAGRVIALADDRHKLALVFYAPKDKEAAFCNCSTTHISITIVGLRKFKFREIGHPVAAIKCLRGLVYNGRPAGPADRSDPARLMALDRVQFGRRINVHLFTLHHTRIKDQFGSAAEECGRIGCERI